MKRPRMALSLVLTAMAALVLLNGLPPADRGVAADFTQGAIDPLCPVDFPRVCEHFEWFERIERDEPQPVDHGLSLSAEEDEAAIVELVELAHRATDVYRFLMENFSWGYEPVQSDIGLATEFNYGAADVSAYEPLVFEDFIPLPEPRLAANNANPAATADIAIGWRGFEAFSWISDCDLANTNRIAPPLAPTKPQTSIGDLSVMMAIVRCESYDLAAEMNEENQGLEPSTDGPSLVANEIVSDFDLPLFTPDFFAFCEEEPVDEDLDDDAIDAGPAYESFTWHNWPLPGSWLHTPSEEDWAANAAGDEAPLLGQRESIDITPIVPADDSPCHVGRAASDVAAAARLSYSLADTLARMANLLNAASQEMEDVTDRIAREAAQRDHRSARVPSEHQERREVQTSDIIWVEI